MSETKRTPSEVLKDISPQLSDGLRQYVEGAVNARPKVEELLEEIIERTVISTAPDFSSLLVKAREVEAALGGKAE